jgi:hypothetical protein
MVKSRLSFPEVTKCLLLRLCGLTSNEEFSGELLLTFIDVFSSETKPKPVKTLATNLESPVNLTVAGQEIWVTESRIRHRILPGREKEIPNRFFIRRFMLPAKEIIS